MRRMLYVLHAVLLAVLWSGSVLVYNALPETLPVHFNFAGEPDGLAARSWLRWLALPVVATGLAALLVALVAWILRHPDLVSLPNQRRYDRLRSEHQQQITGYVADALLVQSLLLVLLFGALQAGAYAVAQGAERLPWYTLVLLGATTIGSMFSAPLFIAWLAARIRRLEREQARATETSLGQHPSQENVTGSV